jgi:integrase
MTAKRRGEASISKESTGRRRVVLGRGRTYGKRQRKYLAGATRYAAQQQLDDARREQEQEACALGSKQTVQQFLEAWLEDTARHRLRPVSFTRYRQLVEAHIRPTLGKVPLAQLTPQDITRLYSKHLAEGLSPSTVQFVHMILRSALSQALEWGLIVRNPTDGVQAPRRKPRQICPLDHAQAQRFLKAAEGHRLEALYRLAVMVGMRLGELLGLQWADIDWTAGRLQVRHTLHWYQGREWRLDEPKTSHGRRTIRLPATALQALQTHQARQAEQRRAAGPAWEDHDLVFCTTRGRPTDAANLRHHSFARLLARADLPRIRFHDLRHTYATLALREGVPVKVVSEVLGHARITVTLDVYSHVLPDMQEDAASRMERLLGKASDG